MIRVLASLGASVRVAKKSGTTPLYIAAQNGHVPAIRVLLSLGADIEATRAG